MAPRLSPPLSSVVDGLRRTLAADGITLRHTPIEYGVKLALEDDGGNTAAATLYHSPRKRRFRLVETPGRAGPLQDRLRHEVASLCGTDIQGSGPRRVAAAAATDDEVLDAHLARALRRLNAEGLYPRDLQVVPYGVKLAFTVEGHKAVVTMYHSAKKGLSVVPAPGQPLAEKIARLMRAETAAPLPRRERDLEAWIGTDEAGKGDYFGPLVVSAVHLDGDLRGPVEGMGVTDSKRLADDRLLDMARRLRRVLGDHAATVVIGPPRYNELMEGPRRRGLNGLLAWAHGRAVADLLGRGWTVDAVVVDRFADEGVIGRQMPDGLRVLARPRAEDNPAVAAASILARSTYLRQLQRLGDQVGATLRPGAGQPVIDTGRALVKRHGAAVLRRIAKHHFRTTGTILDGRPGAGG